MTDSPVEGYTPSFSFNLIDYSSEVGLIQKYDQQNWSLLDGVLGSLANTPSPIWAPNTQYPQYTRLIDGYTGRIYLCRTNHTSGSSFSLDRLNNPSYWLEIIGPLGPKGDQGDKGDKGDIGPQGTVSRGYDNNGVVPDPDVYMERIDENGAVYISANGSWVQRGAIDDDELWDVSDKNGDGAFQSMSTAINQAFNDLTARVNSLSLRLVTYTDPAYTTGAAATLPATLPATSIGQINRIDATNGVGTTILPSVLGLSNGSTVTIRKIDTTVNRVTVRFNNKDVAWLTASRDWIRFILVGGTWLVDGGAIAPLYQIFTASQNITIPPNWSSLLGIVAAGSSGGGSGRRGAANTSRFGGSGGHGGQAVRFEKSPIDMAGVTAVAIAVGAGGAGGAAVTTDDTDGNAGGSGANSRFGASTDKFVVWASGPFGGVKGSTVAVTNTTATAKDLPSGSGASAISAGNGQTAVPAYFPGGGSGGGISTTNVTGTGGGGRNTSDGTILGGAAAGAAGTSGAAFPALLFPIPGESGGGGAAGDASNPGGTGGNGGGFGGGGGGGGASVNGFASGAGGAGTSGFVALKWSFTV